jgi:2-haloacid dehalogenase
MAPARPALVIFDVNETLTDMSPVRERIESTGAPGQVFEAWFASTLRDGFAVTTAGAYADFADIARHQLVHLLSRTRVGPDHTEAAAADVLAVLPELDLHPDVADGLRALNAAGVRLATLTNGAVAMTEGALARAGVLDLFEARISVSEAGRWKPHPDSYAFALDRLGVPPSAAALVAVHPWDVDGAARAGLTAAWLDRDGSRYPPYLAGPDVSAPTLPGLAVQLLGDPASIT